MSTAIATLVHEAKLAFTSRQVSQDINFEAEAGFAVQLLSASDFATKTALGNKQSVIDAVTNVAAIGVSLNPAKKQAYLVPRNGKICLDISYMGLIDLAVATGSINWAQCQIVYANETFELNGYDKAPTHIRDPFSTNKGAIIGAYACVKTPQNDFLVHAMPISEIYAIRDRSEAWKSGKKNPWKTDEGEMIKKTVIKQAYKYWPKTSPALENAIHYLNTDTPEGLAELKPTRKPVAEASAPVDSFDVEAIVKVLEDAAINGVESFRATWVSLTELEKKAVGMEERNRIDAMAKAVVVTDAPKEEKEA